MEICKKNSAVAAVDQHLKPLLATGAKVVFGVGSGSTIKYALEHLKTLQHCGNVVCIPTSYQARMLIRDFGFILGDLDTFHDIDLTIDGADEVVKLTGGQLALIKGGGGCHLQEKVVASRSKRLVIIADYRKESKALGTTWLQGIPLEVIPMAAGVIQHHFLTDSYFKQRVTKAELRMAIAKAGPVVTDNGNFIIDLQFTESAIGDFIEFNTKLLLITGIVETGLFIGMASDAYFGQLDGSVSHTSDQ